MTFVLDGRAIAARVRAEITADVAAFVATHGRAPALHLFVAGDDARSRTYVRSKEKAAREVGLVGEARVLDGSIDASTLLSIVRASVDDPRVDGILVQLPLPAHLDALPILDAIDPAKDVDGLHPTNVGLLATGRPCLVPCTPRGCMRLIDEANAHLGRELVGAHAVVVGRSALVGRPVAELLLRRDATVTIAHARTRDLAVLTRDADVLVVAAGRAGLIGKDAVKPGAIVIDVGQSRVPREDGTTKLVGDVDYEAVAEHAGAITPVPGGVGPLTVAMLLRNTVDAANRRAQKP